MFTSSEWFNLIVFLKNLQNFLFSYYALNWLSKNVEFLLRIFFSKGLTIDSYLSFVLEINFRCWLVSNSIPTQSTNNMNHTSSWHFYSCVFLSSDKNKCWRRKKNTIRGKSRQRFTPSISLHIYIYKYTSTLFSYHTYIYLFRIRSTRLYFKPCW